MQELRHDLITEQTFYQARRGDADYAERMRRAMDDDVNDGYTVVRRMKLGRNDACPCGSGKKFKKCCIGRAKLV